MTGPAGAAGPLAPRGIRRREFPGLLAGGLLGAAACLDERGAGPDWLDWKIRGALVVDGTGAPGRVTDLGIRDGRFAPPEGPARRELDGSGLVAAPGFIDLHSHGDLVLQRPGPERAALLAGRLAQGITTEIIGNCGLGAAPRFGQAVGLAPGVHAWMTPEGTRWDWTTLADAFDRLETLGLPLHVGALAPHGLLRLGAMGLSPGPPDAGERRAMERALDQALEEGALGLSCGLIYPPGMFSDTAELVGLASRLARGDRVFTAHIRGSSETLSDAVEELIAIGKRAGVRIHHSHAEAVGRAHWAGLNRFLDRERAARRDGVRISADMFPYPVAATMMYAIYPPWALEGGPEELLSRLRDPWTRRQIREEIDTRRPEWPPWRPGGWPHNLVGAVGWRGIRVASVAGARSGGSGDAVGATLEALGAARGVHPFDAVSDLMLETGGAVGQFVLDISGEDGLRTLAADPDVAFVTDANDYGRGNPHPAAYGAFPRVLRRYVREDPVLTLEEALRRMTSLPAEIAGLRDRGRIGPGRPADLVLFDPSRIADAATLEAPRQRARGIRATFVEGVPVTWEGRLTGAAPGRILRA